MPAKTGLKKLTSRKIPPTKRQKLTYAERIEMDKEYVQTHTFWGDVWIILKTIPAVLMSVGAK